MTTETRLDTLDAQQVLLTDGIAQMLQGAWVGFPSLQADLEALSPGIELSPRPPLLTSAAGPPTPPWYLAQYDPNGYATAAGRLVVLSMCAGVGDACNESRPEHG